MIRVVEQFYGHARISRALSGSGRAKQNWKNPRISYIILCKATRTIITCTIKTYVIVLRFWEIYKINLLCPHAGDTSQTYL
jgi:hypothetical protein